MNKFFLLTRGRTGSTAVIDELNKSQNICAMQELFMQVGSGKKEDFVYVYNLLMPFDIWKAEIDWLRRLPAFIYDDSKKAERYMNEAESLARRQGAKSFGFKVLSNHLKERPYIGRLLKERGYLVIYLTRNLARQVLSGMVANERGVFGVPKDFGDSRRYYIDLGKFERLVDGERDGVEKDQAWLDSEGFRFIDIAYEDFLSDRHSLYDKVFGFLGLPPELPPPSDWGIAIKDLRYTIENYGAVAERAAAIGVPLE